MKTSKTALVAALWMATTAATACSTSNTTPQAMANTPSATAEAQSCADLGGTAGPDQLCHVHNATTTYTLDMSYPIDYPDQAPLTDVLTQHRDAFVDWVAKADPNWRARPYEYIVTAKTYRSGTADSGTQSVVLTIQDDTGLAHEDHPNTSFVALSYDLRKQTPISFEGLFKPGTQPLDVLNPIVLQQLQKPGSDWVVNDLDSNTYRNFAITDDAVIFFFGEDQVIRDNMGSHTVAVPRAELASLLA
jgi:hypothetical protein